MAFDTFVAIDLETTGLDPARCAIVEFGAVRVAKGRIADRFSRLVRQPSPLPPAIERLTGITAEDLARGADPALALAEFLEFIGADPLVAHNARFEGSFLTAAAGTRFRAEILDSLELARIVLPDAPGHGLGRLAALLELQHGRLHRAEADAELGARLWLELVKRARALPLPVLAETCWMLGPVEHPFKKLFLDAERAAMSALGEGEPEYVSLLKATEAQRREDFEPGEPPEIDPSGLATALADGGSVAGALDGYEPRSQQQEMCRRVAESLNAGQHLAVEAGTGVGKSLAYLLPAAAWTESGARKVVVSTNTKNLQSQLFGRDLPLLEKALGRPLGAALLKGRGNYLCLRKLLYLMREAGSELDASERPAMLPVLVWAARTETGDIAECSPLFLPGAADLPGKLTTDGPDCLGGRCPQRRRCFLMRARAAAQAASIIVANHSLVLAELRDSAVLPPYAEVIFDEAHNLEAAATRHLSVRVYPGRFYRALNRLFRFRRQGRGKGRTRSSAEPAGTGLLPSLFEQLGRAADGAPEGLVERLRTDVSEGCNGVVLAIDAMHAFCDSAAGLWSSTPRRDKLRYSGPTRRADQWAPVVEAKERLVAALSSLQARVSRVAGTLLEDDEAAEIGRAEELGRDLQAAAARLRELIDDTDFAVRADDAGYVYWAELSGREMDSAELWAAPLDVAKTLATEVFSQKRCCILSSATLTVAGKFDYILGRLGLTLLNGVREREDEVQGSRLTVHGSEGGVQEPEVVYDNLPDDEPPARRLGSRPPSRTQNPEPRTPGYDTLLLGTPFDFREQCRVLVPAWLPEPGTAEAGRNSFELADMIAALCRVTRGRTMVLFTSYGALDETDRMLRPALEPDGIAVLAQGQDGSRESLLEELRTRSNVVLLGTSSFWEGVDVRGPALSCLVMARLPFQVHTDPLFQARAELVERRGDSSFMNYSVPEAVLRFRQGFGRLIRSRVDRGIAVLADRRLVSKRYGRVFLQSLPCPWSPAASPEQLVRAAEEFFGEAQT